MISSERQGLVNPFKALRERQGISQYELARRTSLSKHAILRAEQGMYENPLPTLIDYFVSHGLAVRSTVEIAYANFQIQTRESNSRLLGDLLTELPLCPVGKHPLAFLRENQGINPTELAKRLCIAQNTVHYFERRPVHQKSVPSQLINALHDADYTEQETHALSEAYTTYRAWIIDRQGVALA